MEKLKSLLFGPSRKLTSTEDQLGARLFAVIMLVHFIAVIFGTALLYYFHKNQSGASILNDMDTRVFLLGNLLVIASYILLRIGYYKQGTIFYLGICLAMPLTAPFVPDPDAEITLLATAIVPIFISALVFSQRWVILLQMLINLVTILQLNVNPIQIKEFNSAITLLLTLNLICLLIILFKRHINKLSKLNLKKVIITEQKNALLLESIPDTFFIISKEGIFREWKGTNDSIYKNPQELQGKSIFDLLPGIAGLAINKIESAIKTNRVETFDYNENIDGALHHYEIRIVKFDEDHALGIMRDITDKKLFEESLTIMANGLAANSGEQFFHSVMDNILRLLNADLVLAGELLEAEGSIAAFAIKTREGIERNFNYSLTGTPCNEVVKHGAAIFPSNVPELFPDDLLLRDMGMESYAGIALHDNDGKIIGLISVLWKRKLTCTNHPEDILRIFAARAGAELVRFKFEKRLKENEEKYRFLAENANDIIWTVDKDLKVQYASNSVTRLTGFTVEEILNKPLGEILTKKSLELAICEAKEALEKINKGERSLPPVKLKFEHLRKNGSTVWTEAQISTIMDEKGNFSAFLGVSRDISDRIKVENDMNKFKLGIETSAEAIFITDIEGNIIYANPAFEKVYGFSQDEVLGKTPRILKSGLLPDEAYTKFWETLLNRGTVTGEIINRTKDGRMVTIEGSNNPILGEDDIIIGFLGVHRDITRRKQAENAILESEEKLKQIFEKSPVGIMVSQKDIIISANSSLLDILGYNESEMIGTEIINLFLFENDYKEFVMQLKDLSRKNLVEIELSLRHKSGKTIIVKIISTSMKKYNPDSDIISIVEDITKKKQIEEDLQKLAKIESLGILAGGIAHNFKNILTSMALNVELLKYKPDNLPRYIDNLMVSINQASALATRFQTFSKSGEPVLKHDNANHLVIEASEMAGSGSNIPIKLDLQEDLWMVNMDSRQMNEVMMNLLINAQQAMTGNGKITLTTRNVYLSKNQVPNLETGDYVKISVQDDGIGIKEEFIKDIFNPFFTTKESGNGLGLTTVIHIIKKHNGAVTVDSKPGIGTRFDIYLPAIKEKISANFFNGTQLKGFGKKVNILLMDDDKEIREGLSEISDGLNINLFSVDTPERAIESYNNFIMNKKPIDIVILDLTIKGSHKDGVDVLNKLKVINPDVKAIVFSGHSTKPIVARYSEYGFTGRIEKPINLNQFVSEINRVINN